METASSDINFDVIFKIMLFGMRINRSHPKIPRDKKWICQFGIMHGIFFFVFCLLVYNTVFHDFKKNDFTQACANGIIGVIFSVVTFKYCIMLVYQDILKGLMDEMTSDYEVAKTLSKNEKDVVLNYAMRGRKVVNMWLLISTITASLFIVKALFLMSYYWIIGEFRLVPLYDLTYPSPVEEVKKDPIVFVSLFILLLFYDLYAMIMYIAMAPLGPVFMLHGTGQLELVKNRLLKAFYDTESELSTLRSLNEIVRHLQKVYSFLDRVEESFKILYELTLKASVISLPISFYQVIKSYHNDDLRIEFITMIVGAISLSSIPCYYSDKLMEMGEEVRLAVYMCGWEAHLDRHKRLRTTLLLIHSRAARSVAIQTMFRTVSLDALTDVYHQAYAIFNVLSAAWN